MECNDGVIDGDELAPAVRSILAAARSRSGGDRVDIEPRSLTGAFENAETNGHVPVIAELKPTSPTTDARHSADPVELAEAMVEGGAAVLSVLTEPEHFGGSPEVLSNVREAVDVPILRKDFLLSEAHLDVVESDLVLLIARFLEDDLAVMLEAAQDRGFQTLVEVHTKNELEYAIEAGASIIGVNNRDLATLSVDLETFERVAPHAPDDVTLIAESGISTPTDVHRMRRAGADGLLVGSSIMAGLESVNAGESVPSDVTGVIEKTRELTSAETTRDTGAEVSR